MNIDERCYGYEPAASQLKAIRSRLGEAEDQKRTAAVFLSCAIKERNDARALLAEAEADLRIAFGWGDPFDMTPDDAKVWHRLNAKYLGRES